MLLVDKALEIATTIFQYPALKTHQNAVLEDFLAGSDLLLIAPTGSGKSLCYQIPALLWAGTFIVVSPLIALMNEQVAKLKMLNIKASCLHSAMDVQAIQDTLENLKSGEIKLLYVTPERLVQNYFLTQLKKINISGFAIDEAHCILQWGEDFRPEYEKLGKLKAKFPNLPIMALTATATPIQQQLIIEKLNICAKKHIHSAYKDNIHYHVNPCQDLKAQLISILHQHPGESGIIYCATRRRTEMISRYLYEMELPAFCYHAGLAPEIRQHQQQLFQQQETAIMVATTAFGMGIDKKNIRFVIHYDSPGRFDQFIQESGRAGRDGKIAHSYLLYHPKLFLQLNLWNLKTYDFEKQQLVLNELQFMTKIVASWACVPQQIVAYFEHKPQLACQICDACQSAKYEDLESILKLLSCIYRMGNDAVWNLVVEIMMGKKTSKTKNHHKLSTFGIGQCEDEWFWYAQLCQAYANDWIKLIIHHDNIHWQLTSSGRALLKQKSFNDNRLALPELL